MEENNITTIADPTVLAAAFMTDPHANAQHDVRSTRCAKGGVIVTLSTHGQGAIG
jgi:hypothetical protein